MVGRRKREMSGIVLNYFYAIGEAAVGLAAWLCRDWVFLQLVVSVPPTLFVLYYWFVPESVRWLLAKKRYTKANRIVRKAAAINGVVLSDTILATFSDNSENSDEVSLKYVGICPMFIRTHPIAITLDD
jgi:MFS transporter, OCT family, solute carrier family 22 (organic cation transporter), member 4/5